MKGLRPARSARLLPGSAAPSDQASVALYPNIRVPLALPVTGKIKHKDRLHERSRWHPTRTQFWNKALAAGDIATPERVPPDSPQTQLLAMPSRALMTQTALSLLARLMSGASVRWIDSQPDTCQRVYFANHTSHLDAIVVWSALPMRLRSVTRPVAAKDYWIRGRVRRYVAKAFNALLIDRKEIKVHQSPVDLMIREIGDKYSLIVFPEGGRSAGDEVGEFKSGLYYLCKKRPDLEAVPVHIDNLNRVLPRGEFLPVPLLSCISFGAPIWLESGESKVNFLSRAREAVIRLKDA